MTHSVLSDPRDEARALVQRYLFGTFAGVCGAAAVAVASNLGTPSLARWALALAFAAATLYSLAALRWPRCGGEAGITALCLAGIGLVAGTGWANGWGFNTPVIGYFAVFTFLVGATVNLRLGLTVALGSAAVLGGLAWAEHAQWLPGARVLETMSVGRRLLHHLILLVVGLAGGLLVSRVFAHYLGASRERELRFQGLLGIAVDMYWEMDADYRVTTVWRPGAGGAFVPADRPGVVPWDLPGVQIDARTLAGHRADLEARRPFRNLPARCLEPDGSVRHEMVSGEPRFAPGGRFEGYWGVSRDVSDRVAAAEALRRSEAMLSHLVTTSPDLITLTDLASGRYVMVNAAFESYSGYRAEEAVGRTSIELGVWGDPAHRDEFVRRLREHGAVKDLPIEFLSRSGRRFMLLVSAARFELEGGSYIVLNGRDVSAAERTRLAHEAVLANASLGIAFTREQLFVQANPALEKMLGWASGTLTGQPGRAVWASDAEYAEVGALIAPGLSRGESVEFVRELRRRDGSTFWCRMLAKAVDPAHPMGGGTIWIVEDITERRRTEQALAKARDDAEAASEAKSAFLANTSHEIRTPLNGLVGLARLARRPGLDEERRRRYLDQIADSAETLSAVISDVLDLSKIEAGKLDVESVGFNLHELLGSLAQVYRTLADARGLGFTLEIDTGVPPWVQGDPVRLRQILGNYLNNALKFTARGQVGLRVAAGHDEWLRFEVHDSGPGIDPQVQARLFHPFMQADQSTTRRFGGSGLGLSICRELATLMHGRVGVRSRPGQGSRFWLELPLPECAAQADPSAFGALEGGPLAGAQVLMAEDNPVNMTIAVALLEQWGVAVTQAVDGAQAIAAVEAAAAAGRPFDVVLMDVHMPVMSGYEATRRLRASPVGAALPIIALTAAALTSEREQALAAGMSGFLTKPIDARRLHDALVAALAS